MREKLAREREGVISFFFKSVTMAATLTAAYGKQGMEDNLIKVSLTLCVEKTNKCARSRIECSMWYAPGRPKNHEKFPF